MSAENISYDLKRFAGIKRDYTPEDVERLRGSLKIEYSLCKHQSKKLWNLLNSEPYVNTLGSLSGIKIKWILQPVDAIKCAGPVSFEIAPTALAERL